MHWWVRDGVGEFELELVHQILTGDVVTEPGARAPAVGEVLAADDAAALIGRLAADPTGLDALRRIHVDLAGGDGGRSLSHMVLVADLVDAIHRGRLAARRVPTRHVRTDPVESATTSSTPSLQDLADLAPPPMVAAPPPLSPDVAHQIRILEAAAGPGVPFCEECECD